MDSKGKTQKSEGSRSSARKHILDAAEELFAANGFNATTTQRISKESGTPSGLIFYYFETKQGLLRALLEERSFLPELRNILQGAADADPRSTLVSIGIGFLQTLEREKNLLRILLGESLTNDAVSERFAKLRGEAMGLIASYLQDAVRDGRLQPVDPLAVTRSLMYTMLFTAVFEDVQDPQALVEETVNLLLENRIPDS